MWNDIYIGHYYGLFVVFGAVLFDTLWGDPLRGWHPVAIMGKLATLCERIFYREKAQPLEQMVRGGIYALVLWICAYCCGYYLVLFFKHYVPYEMGRILGEAVVLSFMIAPRSLFFAGQNIGRAIYQDDLQLARCSVGQVVGRDSERMQYSDIIRAAVETIAENTTDGVIAPLFWYFVGGLPAAVLYRMINTLDSMVGYRNVRYEYFGKMSARLDDIANLLPSRLAGILFVFSAAFCQLDYKNAWATMWRDASKHPSPNGGYTEAAVAGALDIRLGGYNYYRGEKHFRAYMGYNYRQINVRDIKLTGQMMYFVLLFFLLFMTLWKIFLYMKF